MAWAPKAELEEMGFLSWKEQCTSGPSGAMACDRAGPGITLKISLEFPTIWNVWMGLLLKARGTK